MAPQPGADGLIAFLAKVTSARVLLALVIAALLALLSGCGGGSSSPSTTTSASSLGARDGQQSGQGEAPASSKSAPKLSSANAKNPSGTSHDASAKQGPRITPPKGPQEPAPTRQERAEATLVSINLESPALLPGPESVSTLPATYTCDGKDTWPALRWQGVPPGTAELALLVLNLEPVGEALFFDWALAGLDPGLEEIDSGHLPKGAVVGRNSFGKEDYSICPLGAGPETYIFALYALPRPLAAKKGFDPAALRKQILAMAGNTGILATSYGNG